VSAGTPNSQRIAVLARTGEMELAFALVPEPTDVQVRVKITYVGICGSDLEAYRGSRSPEFMTTPARLGHEVAGVIDKVGASVVGLRVGDQVTCRYVWGEFSGGAAARACGLR
jgi:L-iditol 2-dehydrogenase